MNFIFFSPFLENYIGSSFANYTSIYASNYNYVLFVIGDKKKYDLCKKILVRMAKKVQDTVILSFPTTLDFFNYGHSQATYFMRGKNHTFYEIFDE